MKKPDLFQRMNVAVRKFGFKQWFLLILNILLVLGAVGCAAGVSRISGTLTSLTAASRFRGTGEGRFAQLACYLPVDGGKTEDDIRAFRQSLENKMVEQSLEAQEGGRLYLDGYSGVASLTVRSDNGGNAAVKAIGVGGDFFYFHPLTLRSGAYIKGDDLMDDLVVLDEEMAWRLFGGVDLAGLTVYLNGEPFVIAGVIARETDFATNRAYTGDGGIYMSFSAMCRLNESAAITSYEIVMPNPITGYAREALKDVFPIGEGDIVENSSRYSLTHLWEVIQGFGQRSMRLNGVIYPYWENAARLTEDYAALLAVLVVLLSLCPLAFVIVLGIRDIRRVYRFAKVKVPEKVDKAVEKHREKRLEKAYEKKREGED